MSGRRIPNYDPIADALGIKPDAYAAERSRMVDAARLAAGDPPAPTSPVPAPVRRRAAVVTSRLTREYCPRERGHRWVVIAAKEHGQMVEACEVCEAPRFEGLSTIHPENRAPAPSEHDRPRAQPEYVKRAVAEMRAVVARGRGAR